MEDVEHQHAEEEKRADDADISGELLLGVAKEVEGVERRCACASACGLLYPTLKDT